MYYYKTFKDKLTAMSWEQLTALFEQYSEMESRSVLDGIKLEMIKTERNIRETEEDLKWECYNVYGY